MPVPVHLPGAVHLPAGDGVPPAAHCELIDPDPRVRAAVVRALAD